MEFIILSICIIGLIVYIIAYIRWCKTHKRPLTDDEIERLSKKRIQKEIKRVNKQVGSFEKGYRYSKNTNFNSNGQLYNSNIDSVIFPSYIASQLHGKKHEWAILGLVKEGVVIRYWANKGIDRSSVSLKCDINQIIDICKNLHCTAILDLHNHPNSNPSRYNCLVPSQADERVSAEWFEKLNNNGISLYSFVCERGNWLLYYKALTTTLQVYPEYVKIEYIKKENGVSEEQNLKLHKELGIFHR